MALSFIFGPLRSVTMGARINNGGLDRLRLFVSNEVCTLSSVYQFTPLIWCCISQCLFAFIRHVSIATAQVNGALSPKQILILDGPSIAFMIGFASLLK